MLKTEEEEIFRAQAGGRTILRITTELPVGTPQPVLEPHWLSWVLGGAVREWIEQRRAA